MECTYCHEPIHIDWYFCRWCGTALAPSTSTVTASQNLRDGFLNALILGGQIMQAQAKQAEEARKVSQYQPGEAALRAANNAGVASTVFPNL